MAGPKPVSKARVFGLGVFGTVMVYAVHYLRNPGVIDDHTSSHGAGGVILSVLALLVIALGSGVWVVSTGPRSSRKAISIGLGVPALIFAGNLGQSPAPSTSDHGGWTLPFSAIEMPGGLLGDSLGLVFGPVQAVERHGVEQARQVYAVEVAGLEAQVAEEKSAAATSVTRIESLTKEVNDKIQAAESQSQAVERLTQDSTKDKDEIKSLQEAAAKLRNESDAAKDEAQRLGRELKAERQARSADARKHVQELGSLKEQIAAKDTLITELRNAARANESRAEVKELQKRLDASVDRVAELEGSLKDLAARLAECEESRKTLSGDADSQRAEKEKAERERQALQERLDECGRALEGAHTDVPDLTGMTEEQARGALQKAYLFGSIETGSGGPEAGKVFGQKPEGKTRVLRGDTVRVQVAPPGPAKEIKVPNVLGLRVKEAREKIEASGLRVAPRYVYLPTSKPTGFVLGQNPRSGTLVVKETEVTLTVDLEAPR